MFDLKKLEEKLDAALAKETPESLDKWLDSKARKPSYEDCIGWLVTDASEDIKKNISGTFHVKSVSVNTEYTGLVIEVSTKRLLLAA